MSRTVPTLASVAALLLGGCFDLSEVDPRRGAGDFGDLGGGGGGAEGVEGDPGEVRADCPSPDTPTGFKEGDTMLDVGLARRGLKDRDGVPVSLYDGCGKVNLIGIGAGWCVGCREEMPEFVHWQAELPDDLAIYYVLWQDDLSQPAASTFIGDWVDEYSANFPVVSDPTGSVRNAAAPSLDLPTTILLDRDMVIRKIRFYSSTERLRIDLDELIAE